MAELTKGRMRRIAALAPRAGPRKARELYREVYGAKAALTVPDARVRASVAEAVKELLGQGRDTRPPINGGPGDEE